MEKESRKVSEILTNLNPEQCRAVENYDHTALIIAGAGSGKTRVLTHRIAYMIEQGVPVRAILALTFTNKAAREMRERVEGLIGERSRYLWLGTFHSIFAKILRFEGKVLGYQDNFTIYDQDQSKNIITKIIKEMNLSDETYKPRDIQSRISLAKNNLITSAAYEANAVLVGQDREQRRPHIFEIYKRYDARCRAANAMDFDDLLVNINILFRDHPEILAKYRDRFRYMLVDEYQDTNYAQYLILRRLASGEGGSRLCVVGDDSQSIYSFRGAKVENILRFRNDFPDAKIYKLERNYRSTQTIVNAANSVIENNKQRLGKQSYSENSKGEKI
ncbi:MAG: UvrD-helicase domain-containing protein, partial [Tidjanibacter sp.]|nr:UvrD-helicase domain-containing protein [Tidjanibacter sp.]